MKRIILLIILLFVLAISYSNEINKYEPLLIKKIPIGKNDGEIGFLHKIVSGMPRGPRKLIIDQNENIYIPDFANGRINIYDLKLNYLRTVIEKENQMMLNAAKLFIDGNKNIIGISSGLGLKKIDSEGKTILYLKKNNLPNNFDSMNFCIIKNNIFYYDENRFIKCITADGTIKNTEETLNLIKEIEENEIQLKDDPKFIEANNLIDNIKNEKKYIIIGDRYYTSNFGEMHEFFKKAKKYFKAKKELENIKSNKSIIIDEKSLEKSKLIGYDKEHYSYWRSFDTSKKWEEFVFVFSNYGEVIDAFYFEELKDKNALWGKSIKIAITPSGDVYFMRNDETGSYFWKVERRW